MYDTYINKMLTYIWGFFRPKLVTTFVFPSSVKFSDHFCLFDGKLKRTEVCSHPESWRESC